MSLFFSLSNPVSTLLLLVISSECLSSIFLFNPIFALFDLLIIILSLFPVFNKLFSLPISLLSESFIIFISSILLFNPILASFVISFS